MNKFVCILMLSFAYAGNCQYEVQQQKLKAPKLVVGIVVDQMRYDFITRFYDRFGEGGFKRLIKEGFSCRNHHFNYIPTKTAPGHASIFTGTTPRYHGILGNSWYDRNTKEDVYCVYDFKIQPVGTSGYEGRKSPKQLEVFTISDQNKLKTQMKGKTIGISIKDRAAILMSGYKADGAYWYRGEEQGAWISSSYYMKRLPQWVLDFNASEIVDSYFKEWNTLYPIDTYIFSGVDQNNFERGFRGKEKAIFPYDVLKLKDRNENYNILRQTPYGNSLTVDFAIAAIAGEELGKDAITDFLNISFSSTDYIGHNFGANSIEIEDTFLRLDKDLEHLLNTLDTKVGKNSYTVFLTADHGATHVPGYLTSLRMPGSYFKEATIKIAIKNLVKKSFQSDSIVLRITNNQVYLDHDLIKKNGLNLQVIQEKIAHFLINQDGIEKVFTRPELEQLMYKTGIGLFIQNGFHKERSGDVVFTLGPSTIAYSRTGSAHGSGFSYDTHVPLLFYGFGIKKGNTSKKTYVTDIVPTIAFLLNITVPAEHTGTVIPNVID